MGEEPQRDESQAERHNRVRSEAAVIARARAEIAAGEGISEEALGRWLDELDRDADAPLPVSQPILHP